MGSRLAKTGIDSIGDIPWGTHFCSFYQTERDLNDVLIPFIRAGLENNELLCWFISDSFDMDRIRKMGGGIGNFADYLEKGQVEFVLHTDEYLRVMAKAAERGFNGLRAIGGMAWSEEKGWDFFMECERFINKMIGRVKMMALCFYYLPCCSALNVIDVVNTHQFAVYKKQGRWKVLETSQYGNTGQPSSENKTKCKAIEKLACGTAHEINNQMTVIQACLDLCARENSFDLACLKIRQAVESTTKLNRQLMLYTRAD